MAEKQTRRGFFRLLGGLAAIGTAMGVAPALLAPVVRARKYISHFTWTVIDPVEMAAVKSLQCVVTMTKGGDPKVDLVGDTGKFFEAAHHMEMAHGQNFYKFTVEPRTWTEKA